MTGVIQRGEALSARSKISSAGVAPSPQRDTNAMKQFIETLYRGRACILAILGLSLIAALGYISLVPARYVASALVLVDPPQRGASQQAEPVDQFDLGTEIQVIQSEGVALRVVKTLGLDQSRIHEADAERFPGYLVQRLKVVLSTWAPALVPPQKPRDPVEFAIATLKRNLMVQRVGVQTQVVEVSYISRDPIHAAMVANALVDAYMDEKRRSQLDSIRQSAARLEQQLVESKSKAEAAERAVEDFKPGSDEASIPNYRTQLKELQSLARSYRSVYDNLLSRYTSIDKEAGPGAIGVRFLDRAQVPKWKSEPLTFLVLVFASIFGLTFGIGMSLLSDYLAEGFRNAHELRTRLGLNVFGEIPKVRLTYPSASPDRGSRTCATLKGAARLVLDAPTSHAADLLRMTCAAIDKRRSGGGRKIIAVASAMSGEGRSTICLNLAHTVIATGRTVAIVDADWNNRSLSRTLAYDDADGIAQVLSGNAAVAEVIWREPVSGAAFVPAGSARQIEENPNATAAIAARFASDLMRDRMSELAEKYDYVLVCLPPLAMATYDATSAARWADGFLIVVEHETTSRDVVIEALEKAKWLDGKIIGAVLNKYRARRDVPRKVSRGIYKIEGAPKKLENQTKPRMT